ncbi:hypothetical protein KP509_11G055900 [Ceratopteris richardii]|uniref:Uncharacterized protein n=1 Tax=Ceratopteris richardii TaxID=49495 RepID=A0A8T2TT52_CERRI|nr:hypothetical protein KP509_11G055900 [Ceratopteris richardii]
MRTSMAACEVSDRRTLCWQLPWPFLPKMPAFRNRISSFYSSIPWFFLLCDVALNPVGMPYVSVPFIMCSRIQEELSSTLALATEESSLTITVPFSVHARVPLLATDATSEMRSRVPSSFTSSSSRKDLIMLITSSTKLPRMALTTPAQLNLLSIITTSRWRVFHPVDVSM